MNDPDVDAETSLRQSLDVRSSEDQPFRVPKTAELGRATVSQVAGRAFRGVAPIDLLPIYASTALFGLAALAAACHLFSRKDF